MGVGKLGLKKAVKTWQVAGAGSEGKVELGRGYRYLPMWVRGGRSKHRSFHGG